MTKIKLLLLVCSLALLNNAASAQSRTITGTVTDSKTGEPIPKATIKVLNSKIGASADAQGTFSIQVPSSLSKVVLSVSSVGYNTAQITPHGDNVVIGLDPANKQLDDVVVVGYGTAKKATLTGAVSSIKSKEITEASVVNVTNGLSGRLPGLVAVTSSSEPGYDGTNLRIRGSNTFNDNSVLVVIDGVPDRSLERIDPYSIESISVLKDASAAIYGSRAANGVILVTTKRGRSGPPELTFNGNYGYNQPTKLPKMADAPLYATALNEIAYYNNPSGGLNQTYTPAQIQKFKDGSDPLRYPNTDWFKTVLKPRSIQDNANLSLSGGTESMRYFVSLDYKHQDGEYKNSATYYNQYGFTSNVDGKIGKDIRVAVDLSGRLEDRHFPQKSAGTIFNDLVSAYPTSVAWWPNGDPGPAREHGENPVVISTGATGSNNDKTYVLNSNLRVDVNIPWIKGLTFNGNVSYDQDFDFDKNFTEPWRLYSWDGTTVDAHGQPALTSNVFGAGANNSPTLYESYQNTFSKLAYGLLNYQTRLGDNHNLKLMIGAQTSNGNMESFNAYRDLFASTAVQEMFAGATANQATGGTGTVNARLSYFGRANYSFANKYLIEFVGRYDGSYIFAPDHRFGFFPGVSAGWVASEEKFWKDNVRFIDYFKLRASWGQTGNDRVADFQYLTSYLFGSSYYNTTGQYYPFVVDAASALSELQTVYESVIANPNITWEVANQSDVGFNANFLDNKLTVEADYFYYKRSNILWPQNATVPASAGLSLPSVNYGKSQNQGFDFSIAYSTNAARSKFNYTVSFNGGYAQNKVLQWGEAPGAPAWQRTTGHPMGSGLYYVADGVIHNSKDSADYAGSFKSWGLSTPPAPGDIRYVDVAKNDTMDSRQQTRIYKSSIPTFTFGSYINLSYKNFDLSMLLQGATGAVTYVNSDGGTFTNFRQSLLDGRWSPTNPNGNIPRTPNRGNYYWDNTGNTFFLHKTDYVRLKTFQLGYTIDANHLQKTGIKYVRVYLSGQNLLTWCPGLKDFDPEAGASTAPSDLKNAIPNISGGNYPLSRVVSMGLTLTF
ncbi:MAG TPA: TonB-dependent receptor [Puia sp.]|nr:TonB-dependent receptor [Puia sp.]